MIASTPVCDGTTTTDLGEAFERHVAAYRGNGQLALGYPETKWLNVMRNRAGGGTDSKLRGLTDEMLNLLADPVSAGAQFKSRLMGLIALHYDKGAYRFDGLFDAHWVGNAFGWSNIEVETVIHALCGDYNDRGNSRAHVYARHTDREGC